MDVSQILSDIDAEIARLEKAKSALTALGATGTVAPARRGRPKGSGTAVKVVTPKRKRNLSPEGRKRIADAMKRRWAERRETTGKPVKKESAK